MVGTAGTRPTVGRGRRMPGAQAAGRRSAPLRAARRRLADPARLRVGMTWLVGVALGYAACVLVLGLGGARPGVAPWLTIPASSYFLWEAVFIAPVIVAGGVLAAGCMHLLARAARGVGRFDDAMALIGQVIGLCTLITLVPDLVVGTLLCAGLVDAEAWMRAITHPTAVLGLVWVYLLAYVAAFLVAFPVVARAAYHVSRARAVAIGWAVFVIYQGFVYVFVR